MRIKRLRSFRKIDTILKLCPFTAFILVFIYYLRLVLLGQQLGMKPVDRNFFLSKFRKRSLFCCCSNLNYSFNETLVRWDGKTKYILIVYFLGNISAKIIEVSWCMSKSQDKVLNQWQSWECVYVIRLIDANPFLPVNDYVTVRCLSVCLSVCPFYRQPVSSSDVQLVCHSPDACSRYRPTSAAGAIAQQRAGGVICCDPRCKDHHRFVAFFNYQKKISSER